MGRPKLSSENCGSILSMPPEEIACVWAREIEALFDQVTKDRSAPHLNRAMQLASDLVEELDKVVEELNK